MIPQTNNKIYNLKTNKQKKPRNVISAIMYINMLYLHRYEHMQRLIKIQYHNKYFYYFDLSVYFMRVTEHISKS